MYTCTIEAVIHQIFIICSFNPNVYNEAIFNQMYSIGAVLIQMYAMDDKFGSDSRTFSAHRPRQVVCQDSLLHRTDGINLRCYM